MIHLLIFRVKCLFFAPLYILFFMKNKNGIMSKDLRQWENTLTVIKYKSEFLAFIRMFAALREYRSLFFFRCGEVSNIIKPLIPCTKELHFITKKEDVAEGLVLQHGYSTIIFAESIGTNCQIWHNVTIGRAHDKGRRPRIGNNVKICTGAVVIGDITIGNNVTIGAGSIVVKDIPDNCIVCGNPARIINRNGEKVNIKL